MAHETPQEVVTDIGRQYVNDYVRTPADQDQYERVREAFEEMAEINDYLFRQIDAEVVFQEEDPYDDYADMRDTVDEEGKLRVFSGGNSHPIWDHHQEVTARAVHDWFGHLHLKVDFSPTGEYLKWEDSRNHYPAFCERVFFTEVVGQLGAVHYLPDGFASDRFEQKVFPAPGRWIDRMSRAVQHYD